MTREKTSFELYEEKVHTRAPFKYETQIKSQIKLFFLPLYYLLLFLNSTPICIVSGFFVLFIVYLSYTCVMFIFATISTVLVHIPRNVCHFYTFIHIYEKLFSLCSDCNLFDANTSKMKIIQRQVS